ncbi:MAG: hypothetical protein HC845_00655 [Akkermansiaceae bacterium]|nr:hypothetical protein [Akkermansiaceae bacterium]
MAVRLFKQGDDPLTATPVATATTATVSGTAGCYLFDNLAPGNYFVYLPASNFASGGPLAGSFSSTGADATDLVDDTANENGIDNAAPATNGIRTNNFALGDNAEPASEAGACASQDDADDNNINLTIDFGFVKPVCIGNFVYSVPTVPLDPNTSQTGSSGLSGATVELFRSSGASLLPVTNLTGAAVASVTTLSTGRYEFCDLAPGDYVVRVTPPTGLTPLATATDPDPDTNALNTDSNGVTVSGQTYVQSPVVTLASGTEPTGDDAPTAPYADNDSNNTVDFGFISSLIVNPVAIGDRVWCDENGNGIQDSGEPGIPNVVVTLTQGANTATSTTDATGLYRFASDGNAPFLSAGSSVTLTIDKAANAAALSACPLVTSPNSTGPGANDGNDSDGIDGATTVTITTTVPGLGTSDLTNDLGFTPTVSLGNFVFIDSDRDGLSSGEVGLAGAMVTLLQSDGVTPATKFDGTATPMITTTADGKYLFTDLAPGDYIVKVKPPVIAPQPSAAPSPTGYVPTTAAPTVDPDANASDIDSNNTAMGTLTDPYQVASVAVTLTIGGEPVGDEDNDVNSNNTVDFGFFAQVGVGNLVWIDKDADSKFTAGVDARVPNVVVQVWPEGANPLIGTAPHTATTDANGNWLVTSAPPGRYFAFIPPAMFQAGAPLEGYFSAPGVEVEPLNSAADDDLGESGIDDSNPAANGIRTRNFNLRIDREPFVQFGETGDNANFDAAPVYDDDSIDLTKDFAFVAPLSVGNLVFNDLNSDGQYASGTDATLGGVLVELFKSTPGGLVPALDVFNNAVTSVTTPSTGIYNFTNLPKGDYVVRFTPPAGFRNTTVPADPDPDTNSSNTDSNIQPVVGQSYFQTPVFALMEDSEPITDGDTDNDSDLSVDAGFVQVISLGDLVFMDSNNNGVFDSATEMGINGVAVQLLFDADNNGSIAGAETTPIATTSTVSGGLYSFTDLVPGRYQVLIPATNFATGNALASKSTSSTNIATSTADNGVNNDDNGNQLGGAGTVTSSPLIVLAPNTEPGTTGTGNADNTIDFGFYASLTLGDLVFCDDNNSGEKDPAEPGIGGVTLQLLKDADGNGSIDGAETTPVASVVSSTVPATLGQYSFAGLTDGNYQVIVPASNFISGGPLAIKSSSSTASNPDNETNDDDNGSQSGGSGTVTTSPIIVLAGGTEPNGTGNNTDNTIDFGFLAGKYNTFTSWQVANPLGGQNGLTQNPDGDGFSNLLEYALCGHPSTGLKVSPSGQPNSGLQIVPSASTADQIDATFIRPSGITDVAYVLQYSSDGQTWVSVTGITPLTTANTNGTETVTYPNLESLGATGLIRLQISSGVSGPLVTNVTQTSGWQPHTVKPLCESYSHPLLNSCVFTGTIDGVSGSTLDLTGSVGTGDLTTLDTTKQYYIEVTSGDNVGCRFDIASFTATSVVLAADASLYSPEPPYNTTLTIPATLTGDSIVLREHHTFASLFPPDDIGTPAVDGFVSGTTVNNSARLLFWDRLQQKLVTYYLETQVTGGPIWRSTTSATSLNDRVFPADQGVFTHNLQSAAAAFDILQYGEVRTNAARVPLIKDYNLVPALYPLDQDYAARNLLTPGGATGSSVRQQADQIQFWRDDSNTSPTFVPHLCYDASFYFVTASPVNDKWVMSADLSLADQTLLEVFKRDRSALHCIQTADRPAYTIPNPINTAP